MSAADNSKTDIKSLNMEQPKKYSADYFCELCDFYLFYPVHGHFECPNCHNKTKCCEGVPLET